MFRPRIIPCLLLKGGGLVKTTQFQNPIYVGDPINTVKIFNDLEADELVFLDIDATPEGRIPNLELVRKIGDEAYMPFAVGGGIKTIKDIRSILQAGAEKVVINTGAIDNLEFIREAVCYFGSQSLMLSIDVKIENNKYCVYTEGGKRKVSEDLISLVKRFEKIGVGEILLTSIDREGTNLGYDLELIKKVSSSVRIPVVAAGGASEYKSLSEVITVGGASAASAGNLFVFVGKRKAVLINYLDKDDINEIFQKSD